MLKCGGNFHGLLGFGFLRVLPLGRFVSL